MIESKLGMAGVITIDVHGESGVIKRSLTFHNLITNGGLDIPALASGTYPITTIAVGSSNTPPAFTDVSLGSEVARWGFTVGGQTTSVNTSGGYASRVTSGQSAQGAAAGTLSEVGIFANNGVMFSRALILDGNGQPTTITVLPNEFLTVTYELRLYYPTTDTVDTVVDGSTTYTITGRVCNAFIAAPWVAFFPMLLGNNGSSSYWYFTPSSSQTLGPITADISQQMAGQPYTTGAYSNGNYYRDDSIVLPITLGNGMGAFKFSSGLCDFQYLPSPIIAKDNTKTLEIHRRISWGRH